MRGQRGCRRARSPPPPTRTPSPLAWWRDLRVPRAGLPGPTLQPAFPGNGGPASEVGWAFPGLRWASPTPVRVRWSQGAPVCALWAGGGVGWGAEFVLFFGPQGVSVGECSRETLLGSGGVFSLSNPSCGGDLAGVNQPCWDSVHAAFLTSCQRAVKQS